MVNKVFVIGRLTRDPEVHETASGGRLSNLRLVTSEFRKAEDGTRKEEVQYHSVVALGRLGEVCADYLSKGRLIWVEGKLRTREWDGKDGLHRYTTEILADTIQFLSPKIVDDDAGEAEPASESAIGGVMAGAGA